MAHGINSYYHPHLTEVETDIGRMIQSQSIVVREQFYTQPVWALDDSIKLLLHAPTNTSVKTGFASLKVNVCMCVGDGSVCTL